MNVTVKTIDSKDFIAQTGGGCSKLDLEITLDPGLDKALKIEIALHELTHGFFPFLTEAQVIEFSQLATDVVLQIIGTPQKEAS